MSTRAEAGTTGVAALIEGRRFVGIELVETHANAMADRLRTAALQPSKRDTQDALDLGIREPQAVTS